MDEEDEFVAPILDNGEDDFAGDDEEEDEIPDGFHEEGLEPESGF